MNILTCSASITLYLMFFHMGGTAAFLSFLSTQQYRTNNLQRSFVTSNRSNNSNGDERRRIHQLKKSSPQQRDNALHQILYFKNTDGEDHDEQNLKEEAEDLLTLPTSRNTFSFNSENNTSAILAHDNELALLDYDEQEKSSSVEDVKSSIITKYTALLTNLFQARKNDPTSPDYINTSDNNNNTPLSNLPPILVEDTSLLLYDILLILNLSVSISFWVVHRMSFLAIAPAFSEGSLLAILWIVSGLYHGAFLFSAVDGHYDILKEEEAEKGGPVAAAMLGLNTMVTTASLRIMVALGMAIAEHRPVNLGGLGIGDGIPRYGEDLIPLEIACGLVLMSSWRMLHSRFVPRF